MTNANLGRKRAEQEQIRNRLIQSKAMNPEVTAPQLAARFGISHVTVRRWLREAGLYTQPRRLP